MSYQVVGHERGDEVVGVVVARLHPQADRGVARLGGGGREGAGEELVLQEAVGGALRKFFFKKNAYGKY